MVYFTPKELECIVNMSKLAASLEEDVEKFICLKNIQMKAEGFRYGVRKRYIRNSLINSWKIDLLLVTELVMKHFRR